MFDFPIVDGVLSYYRQQRSWGKVIFSVACVKNSVRGGGVPGQVPPWQVHPTWSMSGQYASYWNAFLFPEKSSHVSQVKVTRIFSVEIMLIFEI